MRSALTDVIIGGSRPYLHVLQKSSLLELLATQHKQDAHFQPKCLKKYNLIVLHATRKLHILHMVLMVSQAFIDGGSCLIVMLFMCWKQ